MRVIGGSARGRNLKSPPRPRGGGHAAVRPTSDLIRGVIFDMLDAMGADYARVLDLYAGSGALGIEALSRGEGTAEFVESDAGALATIEANLRLTGFVDRAKVHRMPVERAPGRLAGPYTLILADPPYGDAGAVAAIEAIASSDAVTPATVLVLEHHRRVAPPERVGPLALYRTRRHGDTVVSIYSQQEEDAA